MRLQYQMSNGNWMDCGDRTEKFLDLCVQNTAGLTRETAIIALESGTELRNWPEDWNSNCRDGEYYDRIRAAKLAARPVVEMVPCSCGHSVPQVQVMGASMGTSCPDCYDRMSE